MHRLLILALLLAGIAHAQQTQISVMQLRSPLLVSSGTIVPTNCEKTGNFHILTTAPEGEKLYVCVLGRFERVGVQKAPSLRMATLTCTAAGCPLPEGAASPLVLRNGLAQQEGAANDYTVVGSSIVPTTPLLTGDAIAVVWVQ